MGLLAALPPLLPIADIYISVRLSLTQLDSLLSPSYGKMSIWVGGNYFHIILALYQSDDVNILLFLFPFFCILKGKYKIPYLFRLTFSSARI